MAWQQQPRARRRRVHWGLVVARDDKRKCRKPASNNGGSASSNSSNSSSSGTAQPQQPPPRIDNTINIPIRKQIQWVELRKDWERRQSPGYRKQALPQKFRQESLDSDEFKR